MGGGGGGGRRHDQGFIILIRTRNPDWGDSDADQIAATVSATAENANRVAILADQQRQAAV